MKVLFRILFAFVLTTLPSCAFYHLQTPQTVRPGKVSIGTGGTALFDDLQVAPGAWMRIGLTPRIDAGLHILGLGVKIDGKYMFNDYLAVGLGGGYGKVFAYTIDGDQASISGFEGSIYTGYPTKYLTPYGVVRFTGLPEDNWDILPVVSAVGGVRLGPLDIFSLYAEIGGLFLLKEGYSSGLIGGAGITIGY